MKNIVFVFLIINLITTKVLSGQAIEKYDIVSYTAPAGWEKETGNGFVAYTINNSTKNEYARILIFNSLAGTGKIDADFDTEWKELIQLNYQPGEFTQTNVSDYKDGWISKIGVAPFKYQNGNHAAMLLMLMKAKTKMSFAFITNTTTYQTIFEDFGSSLSFGDAGKNYTQQNNTVRNETAPVLPASQQNNPANSQPSGFTFTTSNFDDGWTATVQNDWVLVEKANSSVYLCYALPYNSDNFSGTGVMDRDYYWDNYVAQQFRITTKQYNDAGEFISSMKPKYVEGWGTDPVSGRLAFVVMTLSVSPNTAQLTVASFPDEASFRQAFPSANDKYVSDLTNMSRYNKFAIGAYDIQGTWQNGNTSTAQWYYTSPAGYEGYAGMTVASSSAIFNFNGNGAYTSIHNGATGAVGNMSTFQQEYRGNYSVTNWQITATNRYEGKTDNFDASFTAIRGGRLLNMNNNKGENYLMVRIK